MMVPALLGKRGLMKDSLKILTPVHVKDWSWKVSNRADQLKQFQMKVDFIHLELFNFILVLVFFFLFFPQEAKYL